MNGKVGSDVLVPEVVPSGKDLVLAERSEVGWRVSLGGAVAVAVEDEKAEGLFVVCEDGWYSCESSESLKCMHFEGRGSKDV